MLHAPSILALHDRATEAWHRGLLFDAPADAFAGLVHTQHRANYDLWHEEDKARSPLASDHDITEVKHAIDTFNQRRNDLVEQIDALLLSVAGAQNEASPLHSETPGLMIDRLSILELKLYHTAEEVHRANASEQHRQKNRDRLDVLQHQRGDLATCLDELWGQVLAGQRRFHLYRQLKMYNDPELNPVLYTRA
jgi:hypothetical protein